MTQPTLLDLCEEWLTEKQTLGSGLSTNSELAYRNDLALIAGRLAQEAVAEKSAGSPSGEPAVDPLSLLGTSDLSAARVRGAFADLAREGAAVSSRTRAIGVWKTFCAWLVERGDLGSDPMVGISRPRKPETLPVAFTDDQLAAILRAVSTPDQDARTPWPIRDRALVITLAGTGVRATELCAMDCTDLTGGADPLIRVHGKGGKTRVVPLTPEVAQAMQEYLIDRTQRFPVPPDAAIDPAAPLWVNYRGQRLSRGALKQYVYRWLLRAGVPRPDGEAVHAFRHTFATGLIANGTDIATVRQLLGHSSIASTQIYLRMTGADLASAVRAAPIATLAREP